MEVIFSHSRFVYLKTAQSVHKTGQALTNSLIIPDSPTLETNSRIECIRRYISKNKAIFNLEKIDQTRSVPLDIQSLINDEDFNNYWSTFQTDVFEKPEYTLRLLEFCLHEVWVQLSK